jgi:GNAT superfamily N-acetyltransferase
LHDVKIRPAEDDDVDDLVGALGQQHFFAERLRRQRQGRGLLLVAWHKSEPVGDVYLSWECAEEPEIRNLLPDVPLLIHLEVHPVRRNQGIGTTLLGEAERLLSERGHRQVALGVGVDNERAVRLYTRLGFKEWSHPPVRTWYEQYLDNGQSVRHAEICRIFVKTIIS